ncbi:hypothetical protein SAMD00019534_110320 [Acytostelium subglobosum LB1]|uniref:hypothetical protein n=1 Tax=Acytostelium subglobosum LB1 TaxID=1410327 RepID=UPI000644D98E|nr:hypothetical protein SAMD00019534_110320 [Acytostelium subglobosum LB1]GAM27856.1 hypothetical protein SAMD00019534_110320 [Acytostelium subglobosum LB1]|eukprot:XP_012749139.1 hypothetical protein SAMD00019534_110320 [Acytostelium subglobosum LB1]
MAATTKPTEELLDDVISLESDNESFDDPDDIDSDDEDKGPYVFRYLNKKDPAKALRQLKRLYNCVLVDHREELATLQKERNQYKDKLNNIIVELFAIYKKYGLSPTL